MSQDDEKPPLDAALRHLAEQKRRALTSHPTPQELAAYHAGELPPEAEARILDHLSICPECSDLLLDLSGFADLKPPEGVPELTDAQVEQDWQKLRAKMGQREPERAPAPVVPIRPTAKPERSFWLPIAASLLAVAGFSFGMYQSIQVGKLSRQLQQPSLAEIFDAQEQTRSGNEGETVERMSSQTGVFIPLYAPFEDPISRVEIRNEMDIVLWNLDSPEKNAVGLNVPGELLKPGTYRIVLYGSEGSESEIPLVVQ